MYYFLLFVHIIVCIIMITSILMQQGKGGGLGGSAFGGGGGTALGGAGNQLFGGAGAGSFLTKVTTYAGVAFFLTCIGLWFTARGSNPLPESAAERMMREQQTPVPISQPAQTPSGLLPGQDAETDAAAPATESSSTDSTQ